MDPDLDPDSFIFCSSRIMSIRVRPPRQGLGMPPTGEAAAAELVVAGVPMAAAGLRSDLV